MNNGWLETPKSYQELPWDIKAGKRILWYIELPPCDIYPAKNLIFAGSLSEELANAPVIVDKESSCGVFYYSTATAYKYMIKGPHDET